MSKPRVCPHCQIVVPLDFGFHFDENLNLVHEQCGKIVFSTTYAKDKEVMPRSYGRQQFNGHQKFNDCPMNMEA